MHRDKIFAQNTAINNRTRALVNRMIGESLRLEHCYGRDIVGVSTLGPLRELSLTGSSPEDLLTHGQEPLQICPIKVFKSNKSFASAPASRRLWLNCIVDSSTNAHFLGDGDVTDVNNTVLQGLRMPRAESI